MHNVYSLKIILCVQAIGNNVMFIVSNHELHSSQGFRHYVHAWLYNIIPAWLNIECKCRHAWHWADFSYVDLG